ncbi:DP-EP family protein [Aliiglaciecola sp. LCG003]|uniref:DP-EP family protein n=1 Tax=Aliiglaciecola sp. LCG003 TaxID=3053655 RepID=UPI0025724EFE|nr:DP-EP family protein [Aliiglaciecola sp. LCG003]WJG10112.1 DP-EP family protein [Aliiglaciecola sp. LCG003]
MTTDSRVPQFNFGVSVDISTNTWVIYDENDTPTTKPVTVTVDNTQIIYTLRPNTESLIFVDPSIKHGPTNDLSYGISPNNQVLTVVDSDADSGDIDLYLVVATSSDPTKHYTSPDPQIKNRPTE